MKPFFDLCGDILGETVEQDGKTTEYYDDIVSRAGACLADVPETEKYDVILLDEGQDFSPEMFRVVLSLRRPERDDVMIAMDAEQDLYGRFSLKDLGIDFRGRTHMLPYSYRSTSQIFEFAHRLSGKRSLLRSTRRPGSSSSSPSISKGKDRNPQSKCSRIRTDSSITW